MILFKIEFTFWCHRLDQKTNEMFIRVSALASKKSSNQKTLLYKSSNQKTLLYTYVK